MERTLISFSPQNWITVPLMAFVTVGIFALIYQIAVYGLSGSQTANNSSGY